MRKNNFETGFTLIEMMIAVAIIAILSAVAVPAYQNYVIKTQLTRIYAELSSLKPDVEICFNDGQIDEGQCNPSTLKTSLLTAEPEVQYPPGSIAGTISDNAHTKIRGASVRLDRQSNGEWECHFNLTIDPALIPRACRASP